MSHHDIGAMFFKKYAICQEIILIFVRLCIIINLIQTRMKLTLNEIVL